MQQVLTDTRIPSKIPRQKNLKSYSGWVALVLYTVFTLVLTFPLVLEVNTRIIGLTFDGDGLYYTWSLWWFRQAVESTQDPAYTNQIFGFLPSTQIFVQTYFNAALALPTQWFMSPLASYNILILLGFVLSGFTMYLLAGEFLQSKIACFAAGFFFDFSNYHFLRATGHMGLATLQWLPFCVWRVFIFYRKPDIKNAILAGLGLALVVLSEVYFLAYFALPFGLLFITGKLITDFGWFKKLHNLLLGGLVLFIALVIIIPALLPYLKVAPDVADASQKASEISTGPLSANLIAYFLPPKLNPVFGPFSAPFFENVVFSEEKTIFLGYITLFLSITSFSFRRNRKLVTLFWLGFGLLGFIFSLGPYLYVGANPVARLPWYNLIYNLPMLSNFRAPARLGIIPIFSLALLSAYTIDSLQERFSLVSLSKAALPALVTLFLVASLTEQVLWSFPLPTAYLEVPNLYYRIQADKVDGMVLDVPASIPSPTIYQYYQTVHQKRMVTGSTQRVSFSMINSVESKPALTPFIDTFILGQPDSIRTKTDVNFKRWLQENKITYVILHRPASVEVAKLEAMSKLLYADLGEPFYNNPDEKLTAWQIAMVKS